MSSIELRVSFISPLRLSNPNCRSSGVLNFGSIISTDFDSGSNMIATLSIDLVSLTISFIDDFCVDGVVATLVASFCFDVILSSIFFFSNSISVSKSVGVTTPGTRFLNHVSRMIPTTFVPFQSYLQSVF